MGFVLLTPLFGGDQVTGRLSIIAVTTPVGAGSPRHLRDKHWYRSRVRQHVATTARPFPPNPARERFRRDASRTDCLSSCPIVQRWHQQAHSAGRRGRTGEGTSAYSPHIRSGTTHRCPRWTRGLECSPLATPSPCPLPPATRRCQSRR